MLSESINNSNKAKLQHEFACLIRLASTWFVVVVDFSTWFILKNNFNKVNTKWQYFSKYAQKLLLCTENLVTHENYF